MRAARPLAATVLAALAALTLAACGGSSSSSSSSSVGSTGAAAAPVNQCTKDKLKTRTPGTLTVATDKPAFPPYFEDNDPKNGKGFESAVAYAIAKRLGHAPRAGKWTPRPLNASYAPGPKKFDFDVNQISITPARQKQVDFSTPYFTAPQALVALKSAPAAKAASLGDVQNAKLGVQIGTTSLDAVQQVIKPSSQPKVFNDSNDVVTALKQKQVDAVVVDLPTAFFLTAAQVPSAKIVGQFSAPGGDKWGALLAKGSPLTQCVSQAIGDLREGGQLQSLQQRWMGSAAAAPVRKKPAAVSAVASPEDRRTYRAAAQRRTARRGLLIAAGSTLVVVGGLVAVVVASPGWDSVRATFFDRQAFVDAFPDVLKGFWLDVKLFVLVEIAVLILGLVVALVRTTRAPALFPIRALLVVFTDVFRGIPTILVVYLVGFGVPALQIQGLPSDPVLLGGVGLTLSYTAYVAEVYRAGIDTVHPTQRQAALALGLTGAQAMRFVVLPQAVRRVMPPLLNDFISLQKDVALVAILGPQEAFRVAQISASSTFNYTPLLAAAMLYLLVTIPLARLLDHMQRRARR